MSADVEKDRVILENRAREFAKPLEERIQDEGEDVVVFDLAGERYAVESEVVREIRRLGGLTPLPGIPSFVLGIVNVRGEILSVLDLAKILGLPVRPFGDTASMLVLSDGNMIFGVAVHGLHGTMRLSIEGLQPIPAAREGIPKRVLRGVRPDGLIVMNGHALLEEKALVVGLQTE